MRLLLRRARRLISLIPTSRRPGHATTTNNRRARIQHGIRILQIGAGRLLLRRGLMGSRREVLAGLLRLIESLSVDCGRRVVRRWRIVLIMLARMLWMLGVL